MLRMAAVSRFFILCTAIGFGSISTLTAVSTWTAQSVSAVRVVSRSESEARTNLICRVVSVGVVTMQLSKMMQSSEAKRAIDCKLVTIEAISLLCCTTFTLLLQPANNWTIRVKTTRICSADGFLIVFEAFFDVIDLLLKGLDNVG